MNILNCGDYYFSDHSLADAIRNCDAGNADIIYGDSVESWAHVFQIMPILWPCVIATVLVTYKPAAFLTSRLTQKGDSFHAVITLNIMCTVFLMSG